MDGYIRGLVSFYVFVAGTNKHDYLSPGSRPRGNSNTHLCPAFPIMPRSQCDMSFQLEACLRFNMPQRLNKPGMEDVPFYYCKQSNEVYRNIIEYEPRLYHDDQLHSSLTTVNHQCIKVSPASISLPPHHKYCKTPQTAILHPRREFGWATLLTADTLT